MRNKVLNQEVPEYVVVTSLGNAPFLKTLRWCAPSSPPSSRCLWLGNVSLSRCSQWNEEPCVLKVFFKRDPKQNFDSVQQALIGVVTVVVHCTVSHTPKLPTCATDMDESFSRQEQPNLLPYQKFFVRARAAYLVRQYFYRNLFDRLRPKTPDPSLFSPEPDPAFAARGPS